MERKLATIQRVKSIEPVVTRDGEVAHSVELVKFDDIGWQCVAKKGDFGPGDLAVYIEISTIVPDHPAFEFLRAKGFKVKTKKFVGTTLSQGLALPASTLELFGAEDDGWHLGDDVSEILGVRRFDPELDVKLGGEFLSGFPTHILPKTDQERLQSVPWVIQRANDFDMVATLKYDGTSSTFYWEDGVLHACGRNVEHKPGNGTVYWNVAQKASLETILGMHPTLAIQGEICGPKIQKNRLGLGDTQLFVFGIWDRVKNEYLPYNEVAEFCENVGLRCVEPLIWWPAGSFGQETVESLLELAKGNYVGTKNPQEGLVIRPQYKSVFEYRLSGAFSFKVVSNDYLLGGGE